MDDRMNRSKITFISCILFIIAVLSACTPALKNSHQSDGQTTQNDEITPNNHAVKNLDSTTDKKMVLKNHNEVDDKLQNGHQSPEVKNRTQPKPGVVYYMGNANLKQVALTFDDGPDNYYTPRILDILHAKEVPGTFFIVGKEAQRYPDMVKRIAMEGNALGNHTWDHPKFWTLTNKQATQEVDSTQNEIQQLTGIRTKLFRPPYGRVTPSDEILLNSLGYKIVDWSVDTLDWKGASAARILQLVNGEISPGGIILEHCLAGRPGELNGTLNALPQIIDTLKAKGYKFVTVPALLDK